MEEKKFTYSKKISGLLASFTAFVCSAIIFLRTQGNMSLNTLIYSLGIIISGSLISGSCFPPRIRRSAAAPPPRCPRGIRPAPDSA